MQPRASFVSVAVVLLLFGAPTTSANAQLPIDRTHSIKLQRRSPFRFNRVERCMMEKINQRRVNHGRSRLLWDREIGYVARRHAASLAQYGGVWHDTNMGNEITRWRRLGQNTGRGGNCRRLFRAFWHSSEHQSNILGRWRFVGVGAKRAGDFIYVQQVFESRRDPGNIYW